MTLNQQPPINPDVRHFIVGYGTLMQAQYRQRTHPEITEVYPLVVKGAQRVWGIADKTYGMTYLAAKDHASSIMNAIYYACTPEEIRQSDQREYSYYREK